MNNVIHINIFGISHNTAAVDIREKVSLSVKEQRYAIKQIRDTFNVDGVLIISTCNRTEVYLSGETAPATIEKIRNWMNEFKKCDHFTNPEYIYTESGIDAVKHFFKVVSGIDSLIIGETQITNQVKESYEIAHKTETTDTWINKLFNFGLQTEKKVRSDTFLNDGAVSVSFAGVELARKIFNDLQDKNVLLIGAGETAELAAGHFLEKGVNNLHIINRTYEKALDLAKKMDGYAYSFEELETVLTKVDIVISATSSQELILTSEKMNKIERLRKYKPLFIIDIAIPRDIDPQINNIDSVFLYNIDDLYEIVEMNLERRKQEIPQSLKIIDSFAEEFEKWVATHSVAFMISKLKNHFEEIRLKEMERLKNRLPINGNGEVNYLTQSIINKIVHQHITSLKKHVHDPELYQKHLEFLNNLYELDDKE